MRLNLYTVEKCFQCEPHHRHMSILKMTTLHLQLTSIETFDRYVSPSVRNDAETHVINPHVSSTLIYVANSKLDAMKSPELNNKLYLNLSEIIDFEKNTTSIIKDETDR